LTTVVLHLGVHKTATTSLQSALANSLEDIRKHGINYIELSELRSKLTSKLGAEEFSACQILKTIQDEIEGYDRVIISDENILGGTDQPGEKLYPNATKRLARVLEVFEGYDIEINLVIRDYVDYFISRYSESLRHFFFRRFNEYYKYLNIEEFRWKHLVNELADVSRNPLTVYEFESIFDPQSTFYFNLLGTNQIKLNSASVGHGVIRSKVTQETHNIVKSVARHYSGGVAKKVLNLLENHEQGTPKTSFMPFKPSVVEVMKANYLIEVGELCSNDGVWTFS